MIARGSRVGRGPRAVPASAGVAALLRLRGVLTLAFVAGAAGTLVVFGDVGLEHRDPLELARVALAGANNRDLVGAHCAPVRQLAVGELARAHGGNALV